MIQMIQQSIIYFATRKFGSTHVGTLRDAVIKHGKVCLKMLGILLSSEYILDAIFWQKLHMVMVTVFWFFFANYSKWFSGACNRGEKQKPRLRFFEEELITQDIEG